MKIAVQDANVLIDLELAGLFDTWFRLGIETHTTDLIEEELRKGGHVQALGYFASGQLHAHELTFEELASVSELEREIASKAQFNDCSVLYLAMKLGAMLIVRVQFEHTLVAQRLLSLRGGRAYPVI